MLFFFYQRYNSDTYILLGGENYMKKMITTKIISYNIFKKFIFWVILLFDTVLIGQVISALNTQTLHKEIIKILFLAFFINLVLVYELKAAKKYKNLLIIREDGISGLHDYELNRVSIKWEHISDITFHKNIENRKENALLVVIHKNYINHYEEDILIQITYDDKLDNNQGIFLITTPINGKKALKIIKKNLELLKLHV